MNQVEKDFIEFISKKRNRSYKEIEDIFLATRNRFKFSTPKYRELTDTVHRLFRIMYDDIDEKELIDSYKFYALMHLFRFISYSYPKSVLNTDYLVALTKAIVRGEFSKILIFLKRKLSNKDIETYGDYSTAAKFLVEKIKNPLIVVDYGCGLGYLSFEIGTLNKKFSKIYLVDVDCLTLEFAEFRFRKHGINVEVIPVSKDNLYPELPPHNICICTQIMEHIMQPLKVLQNINNSLEIEGIIYGDFEDARKEMLHISPDLCQLRENINKNFERLGRRVYRRMR